MRFRELVAILLRLSRPHWSRMALMVVLGIASSLTESIGITLFLPLIQALTGQSTTIYNNIPVIRLLHLTWTPGPGAAYTVPLLIAAAVMLRSFLTYASNATNSLVKSQVNHDLRSRLMERLLHMEVAEFERHGSSALWNLVSIETWRCSEAVGVVCALFSTAGVVMVFGTFLCLTSWRLTLAAVISVGIISFLLRFVMRRVTCWSEALVEADVENSRVISDNLNGLREIQAFSLEPLRFRRMMERSRIVQRMVLKLEMGAGISTPISECIYAVLLAAIFLWTARDQSQLPTVFLFLLVLFRLQPSVRNMESHRSNLFSSAGAVREIARFLDASTSGDAWPGRAAPQFEHEIRFDRVSFQYGPADPVVLRNVSLTVPRGKVTAIVGSSGAGKTTLIQLLLGFRRCTGGVITVDGVPLESLNRSAWRGLIGTAFQDAYLFAVSVAENIRYGRPDSTDAEVREAARLAHADPFIREMPQAYESVLAEGGTSLSGGQRQRLALARALLRNPRLLILDEATNALDSVIESTIQEHIGRFGDLTLIVIAHRFSALRNADHVIVMDAGEVVEQGHPDELMQRNGLFAQMSQLQGRVQPV